MNEQRNIQKLKLERVDTAGVKDPPVISLKAERVQEPSAASEGGG